MRIAYVCADPGIPVFGTKGASIHVQEVLRVLLRRGARIDLFCVRTGGEPPAELADVRVVHVALPRDVPDRELGAIHATEQLCDRLRRSGSYDLVYERYSLWGGAGTTVARERGIPAVLEVNAPLIEEQVRHRGLFRRDRAVEICRRTLVDASVVACVSEPVAARMRAYGAHPARTVVVPNGVDIDRFRPPAREPDGPFTVGFVGSLKPWHGVENLVAAFARLPERDRARLLIVGDGPRREALWEQAKRLGITHLVELTGAVAAAGIPAQLRRLHVAVAPYPVPEGTDDYFSPLKVYEYLAAGRAVVASEIGQTANVISTGVNGLLVPPGDVPALAAGIQWLRAMPRLRDRLGAAARATVAELHTWDRTVDTVLTAAGVHLPHSASKAA